VEGFTESCISVGLINKILMAVSSSVDDIGTIIVKLSTSHCMF